MKKPRIFNRGQLLLLPQNMYDWLPVKHLARFVIDTVEMLDLSQFYNDYSEKGGPRPYDASMMVALLLYGYCVGVRSSRKLEQATWTDVAFRVISAQQHPDHDTIATFRQRHSVRLEELFVQILRLAQKSGLLKMGHVSIDGTKIRANASRSKRKSKKELLAEEAKLRAEVSRIFQEAEEIDQAEDELYGKGNSGHELPEHLQTTEGRLKALREAMAAIEEEDWLKETIDEVKAEEPEDKEGESEVENSNDKETTANVTDPDSRIMRQRKGIFNECYNSQAAVDVSSQMIVAQTVVQDANDKKMLVPLLRQVQTNTRKMPKFASADNGYFNEKQISEKRIGAVRVLCPPARNQAHRQQGKFSKKMREFLETRAGRKLYKRRSSTVEPVFGQIKHNRGFRQFLLRGIHLVQTEWSLMCSTHNLMKMWTKAMQNTVPAPA
jgi:transposase